MVHKYSWRVDILNITMQQLIHKYEFHDWILCS